MNEKTKELIKNLNSFFVVDGANGVMNLSVSSVGEIVGVAPAQPQPYCTWHLLDHKNLKDGSHAVISKNGIKVIGIVLGVYSWVEWCKSMSLPRNSCGCPDCSGGFTHFEGQD